MDEEFEISVKLVNIGGYVQVYMIQTDHNMMTPEQTIVHLRAAANEMQSRIDKRRT